MFGLNWFDGLILVFITAAIWRGARDGFVTQFLTNLGFFGALFLGGWTFHYLLPIHDRTLLTIVNGNLVLIFAMYVALRGFDLGRKLHYSFGHGRMHTLETALSVFFSLASALVTVWLLGAMIGRLPFAGFSNSANDALIVQKLDQHLPPVPAVFATFNRLINPNSPAHISLQTQPTQLPLPSITDMQQAVQLAATATVRITSFGCGGVVSGSGFVVAPQVIATNAHVIAGVHRPILKANNHSYEAVPVLFDANLDFALLRVKSLPNHWLNLAHEPSGPGTPVAALGYPNGNYASKPGIIRNQLHVFSGNIYDVGITGRDIYEIQTDAQTGESGGPVMLANGQVAAIMFAKADDAGDYGFALTSTSLLPSINRAATLTRRVSTGACLAN